MLFIFSTPELIRNLWQLKTAIFLHWCLIYAVTLTNLPIGPLRLLRLQEIVKSVAAAKMESLITKTFQWHNQFSELRQSIVRNSFGVSLMNVFQVGVIYMS